MPSRSKPRPTPRDIAAEIIRRATKPDGSKSYVVRLSNPVTPTERLQLIAAHLERRPIVIMPHKYKTVDDWLRRYGELKNQ